MAIEAAWIIFDPGATPTLRAGKRIDSVGRNGPGDYSVNLTDDLVSANALPFASVGGVTAIPTQANLIHIKCEVVSVRQIRIRARNFAGTLTDTGLAEVSMYVHADLTPVGE